MPLLTSCFILWLLLRISNHHGAIYYHWNCKCTGICSNEFTRYQHVTIMRWYTCHINIPLWILSSYALSPSLPLSPASSTSYPCFPDILMPIFVLLSPWTVPSTQRGRTLGKLLSVPSAGHSAGWLRATWGPIKATVLWGPMQATVLWGLWECQRPYIGAEFWPDPSCHGTHWTSVETTPWKVVWLQLPNLWWRLPKQLATRSSETQRCQPAWPGLPMMVHFFLRLYF